MENKSELIVAALAELNLVNTTFSQVDEDSQMGKVWNGILSATHDAEEAIKYLLDIVDYYVSRDKETGTADAVTQEFDTLYDDSWGIDTQ